MVQLMQWWLTVKPSKVPRESLLHLICERRIIILQQPEDSQFCLRYLGKTNEFFSLKSSDGFQSNNSMRDDNLKTKQILI